MPEQRVSERAPQDAVAEEVVAFWRDVGASRWFKRDDCLDAQLVRRFMPLHEAAARGELSHWADTPHGALALLILLDQFPRNAFRGQGRAYATDAQALGVAKSAVQAGRHRQVEPAMQRFFHLPFSHSESMQDQERSVALASALADDSLRWATHHRGIIARFGRFPHRNAVLGRESTDAEKAFLSAGGFTG